MNQDKTILVIEDEVSMRDALKDKLAREGFSTLEARNGQEGLAIALKEHPDMILLDIIMPVMDGMTMLKKLREDSWGKNAKVILLTNLRSNEKTVEAIELGSYNYLVKTDWRIEDVVAKVQEELNN